MDKEYIAPEIQVYTINLEATVLQSSIGVYSDKYWDVNSDEQI